MRTLRCDYLWPKRAKENGKIVVSVLCNLDVMFQKAVRWLFDCIRLRCAALQHMFSDGSSSNQYAKAILCFVYAVDAHLEHRMHPNVSLGT